MSYVLICEYWYAVELSIKLILEKLQWNGNGDEILCDFLDILGTYRMILHSVTTVIWQTYFSSECCQWYPRLLSKGCKEMKYNFDWCYLSSQRLSQKNILTSFLIPCLMFLFFFLNKVIWCWTWMYLPEGNNFWHIEFTQNLFLENWLL